MSILAKRRNTAKLFCQENTVYIFMKLKFKKIRSEKI